MIFGAPTKKLLHIEIWNVAGVLVDTQDLTEKELNESCVTYHNNNVNI